MVWRVVGGALGGGVIAASCTLQIANDAMKEQLQFRVEDTLQSQSSLKATEPILLIPMPEHASFIEGTCTKPFNAVSTDNNPARNGTYELCISSKKAHGVLKKIETKTIAVKP